MAKGDRNVGWFGFFRAFTVLCAIMLLLSQSGQNTAAGGAWQVLSVYEGLTSWAVPALFMLWGMTALEDGRQTLSASLLSHALPTFCLLVLWGAVYAVAAQLVNGAGISWSGIWNALMSAARGNTYFHLWILYPLLGLYLVHPVLHRFVSSAGRSEVRYFLILCLIFANLLPVWSVFHPESVISVLLGRLRIHLVLGWAGCYVGGWYLRHYTIGRITEFSLYILGILGVVFTLMGDSLIGGGRELWYQYTAPNVVLTATALCVLFRYVLGISEERSRRRAVNEVGAYAFGIYLIHQLWVLVFRWIGISFTGFSPILSVPFFALLFFLLSAPFAWLISRIPVVGGYLT